ncbi:DctM6 [Desulforapulum autotrophicum HRM2]|uniref:DctM6 n=1 Tax=Desulforapulum autotrophicum (strain ATCC 43914 / DSM 3382 / VKM B-1955 / HRM2) TaxID=177437 RepID=C0QAW0_DESAH|nr:TRAP transporter large permease subunit [Desulforapulum autotrophicum]ACN16893.1 DctM6 [Desulforapulum autotrophicum HRM2]
MTELLPVLTLIGGLLFGLLTGFPMAFTLASSAIVTAFFFFGPQTLPFVATNIFGMMSGMVLIAMPLFVFMACLLEKSGVAEDLYAFMYQALGPVRGGLAMGTVLICAIIAAMSGVTTTAVVTMGIIALPIMLKQGYHKSIAIGPILAGGALGLLIPPSVSLIVYGMVARVSIGKLFAGGVAPGLILVGSFLTYIAIRSFLQPNYAPALPKEERVSLKELFFLSKGLILPISVVALVLGTIFAGIASPTEAAAVGVAGAMISALINRRLTWALLNEAAVRSMAITGMVMWILFGAACFTSIFFRTGGQDMIADLLMGFENPALIFGFILAVLIVLGFFLDEITQVMITVPVFLPIIVQLGYDPVWFGVLFMTQVQMDYLTPPFGFTLFYMKGVAPPEVSMGDIYRSILPFVLIQLAVVIFILLYPGVVMWLPNLLFG